MPRPVAFLLVLAAAPVPGLAQSPAQRTLVGAFRDSLARVTDTAGLAGLERQAVRAVRGNRGGAYGQLRLGYLTLRLAELGRPGAHEQAASAFMAAARLEPGWPLAWYGLGLAEFGVARAAGPVTAATLEPAARALARAVQADPRLAARLEEAALAARRARDPAGTVLAVEALRHARRFRPTPPAVLVSLGRVEREFGAPEDALRAFDAWLPAAGRLRGLALLEVARTRFLLGRADGAGPYFEGAGADDTTTARHYRDDLALIASAAELAEFDRTPPAERAAYLRRFWGVRDRASLRADGERLREHYRRVWHARRTYPLYTPGRTRLLEESVASGDPAMDDRGLIYVRHGEPDDQVSLATLGVEPNESWRYRRAEGDLVLHFAARHDPDVYRLVESLFDVAETDAPAPDRAGGVTRSQDLLSRSREQFAPIYGQRGGDAAGRPDFRYAERALSRASLVAATATDDFSPRFEHGLGARLDIALFEPTPEGQRLHVALAVPFDSLGAAWLRAGVEYPVRLRLLAFGLDGRIAASLDSTVRPVTVLRGRERWLAGAWAVPLPEGRLRVRVAVQDGDSAGTLFPVRSYEVEAAADSVGLSDLAIGESAGPWRSSTADGEALPLGPLGTVPRGAPVELRYLVRAPGGRSLRAELTVARVDHEPGVQFNRRREVTVTSGSTLVTERLDTRRFRPGLYRLEVTLLDGRGGVARRWREFEVVAAPSGR